MINAVRTLLMNRPRGGADLDGPGEEFIDPLFVPKQWPTDLQRVMTALLGQRPDRLYLNYRMQQIMVLLHTTELEEYVFLLDDRVTYQPFSSTDFFQGTFGQSVDQLTNMVAVPLTIDGEHLVDEAVGVTRLVWRASVLDGTQIQVDRLSAPVKYNNVVTYAQDHGLSEYIALPGSGLKFKFPTASAVGTEWLITSLGRPHQDVAVRIQRAMSLITDDLRLGMFPTNDEPYLTLRNTFDDNDLFPYKASAALIALALYMNTLPQEQ